MSDVGPSACRGPMSDSDRATRGTTILSILRKLDTASLDEVLVVDRVVDRLEVLRTPIRGLAGIIEQSQLDSALFLELTDLRLERDRAEAHYAAGLVREQCSRCGRPEVPNCCATTPRSAVLIALPDRLGRAREMAGLSVEQAALRLGHELDRNPDRPALAETWLRRIEAGGATPSDGLIRDMSALYGVAVSWLCGADPVISRETAAMLRDADIYDTDRATVTEVIGAMSDRAIGGEG